MISFSTPCLNWKYIMALKSHVGFSGFVPQTVGGFPTYTKYLRRVGTWQTQLPGFAPNGPYQIGFTYDRITGEITADATNPPGGDAGLTDFPYVYPNPVSGPGETWTISDDYFQHVYNGPNGFIYTVSSQLSQPYTLAQLDADADALIAKVNPDELAWGMLQPVENEETSVDPGLLDFSADFIESLMPPALAHYPDGLDYYDPSPQSSLGASAFYIYMPSGNYAYNPAQSRIWPQPDPTKFGWYIKMIGYVKMVGSYCEKTVCLDWFQAQKSTSCDSGQGSCAAPFQVLPPPLVAGQTRYKVIVPNCQC